MSAPENGQEALKGARNQQMGIRNDWNRNVGLPYSII